MIGYAVGQRVAAQFELETASPRPPAFEEFVNETIAAVRQPRGSHRGKTLLALARPLLGALLEQLTQAATAAGEDYEQLHQVRIAGKRLRYAMEVLAVCFPPPFRERIYPAVEEMQEILGRANDSHQAGLRLMDLRHCLQAARPAEWKLFRPEIESLARYHRRRLVQERRHFHKWWDHWLSVGLAAELTALLRTRELAS